jgi:hypothetical protein
MKELKDKIVRTKRLLKLSTRTFENACDEYISKHDGVMAYPKFWELIESLKKEIADRKGDIEQGIHNFFCHNAEKEDLIAFYRVYRMLSQNLYDVKSEKKSLWEAIDVSDDGMMDFTDSIILQGREMYDLLTVTKEWENWDYKTIYNRIMKHSDELYVKSEMHEELLLWLPMMFEDEGEYIQREDESLEMEMARENQRLQKELNEIKAWKAKMLEFMEK